MMIDQRRQSEVDLLPDDQWVRHPFNARGFPAIYACGLCDKSFRWFQCDGEAPAFCDRCAGIVHKRPKPRLITASPIDPTLRVTRPVRALRAVEV